MPRYRHGLDEVAPGVFAYLQPNGDWGLSNAGLITCAGESLLVDTLYDVARTRDMLRDMKRATPSAHAIDTVVNTHANGDHCWGNQALPRGSTIIASRRGAAEMLELAPDRLALLVRVARLCERFGAPARALLHALGRLGASDLQHVAAAAPFVLHAFGRFNFDGIELVPPTTTFDGELELDVGGRKVVLLELGPAHTEGDVIVHVPDARCVFTGDLLFADAHPIVWAGPFSNWIRACDRIVALDPLIVVPGHGRLSTLDDVRQTAAYLTHIMEESRRRYEAGMSAEEAARDISLDGFRQLREAERVVVNVRMAYRELSGERARPSAVALFASMARHFVEAQAPGDVT